MGRGEGGYFHLYIASINCDSTQPIDHAFLVASTEMQRVPAIAMIARIGAALVSRMFLEGASTPASSPPSRAMAVGCLPGWSWRSIATSMRPSGCARGSGCRECALIYSGTLSLRGAWFGCFCTGRQRPDPPPHYAAVGQLYWAYSNSSHSSGVVRRQLPVVNVCAKEDPQGEKGRRQIMTM